MGIYLRVLVIEDSEDDTLLLIRELQRGGYDPEYQRVETSDSMINALSDRSWDIIFADYTMPQFNGVKALQLLQEREIDIPLIFVSGTIGEDTAVMAMKAGAQDYIMKDNKKRLVPAVQRELRQAERRRQHKNAEEKIRYMAYYDSLTRLPNRHLLMDRVQQAVLYGNRNKTTVALMVIDLNRFKEINDTLGHHRGDIVLQQVGERLQQTLRKSDTVAYLGGDEFAVLLQPGNPGNTILVAEKIIKSLQPPLIIGDLPITIEASIGIAYYPDHGKSVESLLQHADVAMYLAKETGAGYSIYSAEQDQHTPRRLLLMTELRKAIEQDQLFLQYQPKIQLQTGRTVGAEALVRWQHPDYGLIPPDQFIGLAEKTELIKPLTRWVLEKVQHEFTALWNDGVKMPVSVNLSTRNLHDPILPEQFSEILRSSGTSPECIEVEITESAIMIDPLRAREAMDILKTMGIRFAIDDYGTGYASLAYLKNLPVDEIKIDKYFVMNMTQDTTDAVIIRSTIDMAHNLGLTVIAEGVEDQGTWDSLMALGCDAAQGYFMSPPLSAPEFMNWLGTSPNGIHESSNSLIQ